jgi:DNA-binding MarR family transcriptional regulator
LELWNLVLQWLGETIIMTHADILDVVFGFVEAVRKMFARVDAIWEEVGISSPEAAVLERLFVLEGGRARSGALLGFTIRSTPALGKVLARLESSGMVTRQPRAEDRRALYVQGTRAAKALYDDVPKGILTEVVLPTTADFSEKALATLRKPADRLTPPELLRPSRLS